MAFLLEFHSEAGHEQLFFETPQSFAEPDFLSLDSLVLVLVLARRKCPCQIVMPCLRPKMCIFLFFFSYSRAERALRARADDLQRDRDEP